ncbi:MAG: acyl-CoA thioesterase [Acidimicrobiia bacterium]
MTHNHTVSVTMESVDAVGIAFFAAYWNWFEQAFEGFIAAASGSTWSETVESGLAVPVVHAEIDYLRPLRLSDEVTVQLRLVKTGRRSLDFEARYLADGEPVAVARTVHVVTTRGDLSPAAIPAWMHEAVEPRSPDRG